MLRRLRFWIDDLSTREALILGGELALGLVAFSLAVKLFSASGTEPHGNGVVKSSLAAHQATRPPPPAMARMPAAGTEREQRAELFDQWLQDNTAELFDMAGADEQKQAGSPDLVPPQGNPGAALLPAQILFGLPGSDQGPDKAPEVTGEMNPKAGAPADSGQTELFGGSPASLR